MGFLKSIFNIGDTYDENSEFLKILRKLGLPTDTGSNYWWVLYPQRAVEEIVNIRRRTNAVMERSGKKLIWKEWIYNNFGTRFYILMEAENFPLKMPKIYLLKPDIEPDLKIHMYRDKSLCLIHPDEYNSNMTLMDFRGFAAAWCFCVEVFANTRTWPAAEYQH
jgi:hypothetical protein